MFILYFANLIYNGWPEEEKLSSLNHNVNNEHHFVNTSFETGLTLLIYRFEEISVTIKL